MEKMIEIDSDEAIGMNLGEVLAEYIQDRLTANNKETVSFFEEVDKRRKKNDFTEEEIGEPLKEAQIYNKQIYCTKGGDCYKRLPDGNYHYLKKSVDPKGDLVVRVNYNGYQQFIKVKRIVSHAWNPIPDELSSFSMLWIECKDGNRLNPHASNLRWIAPPKGYFANNKK